MGLLTITNTTFNVGPDPKYPNQLQFRINPGAGRSALAMNGITLQVEIGIDNATAGFLLQQGQQIPQPVTCSALVDTGASHLCIDSGVAQQLNLSRTGVCSSLTANGPRQSNIYAVLLSFPGSSLRRYDVIQAIDSNLSNQPFKCLIGRDVMSRWHFHYDGATGTICIAD